MKLSLVFELLMIFVLLAFAASKSVKHKNYKKRIQNKAESSEVDKIEDNSINKYCSCVETYCNCCRDFALPLVNLNGPGCASLMYLNGDKMAVSLSFGKKVITNRTLSSRKPSPVCMPLPGGLSKFCGRVYNIARTGEDFRACLGLELQSKSVVEAAVRVSCFKFGAKGVTSEPADPLPLIPDEKGDKDDDDDDDEDDYGLGGDDDDDDDDDDADDADDDDEESELEAVNDVEGSDYTGFSLLEEDILGDLFGSSGGKKGNKNKNQNKNKKKQAPAPTTTTTKRPRRTRRPSSRRPNTRTTTVRPIRTTTVRIRPVNKRPTRRPSRRPSRPTKTPTTAQITEIIPSSIMTASPSTTTTTTTITTVATPAIAPVTAKIHIETDQDNAASDDTFEPIIAVRPQSTTSKSVTNFEDTGLEMSLAHITGQLSSMPVVPLNNEPKDSGMATKPEEQVTYQKVEMITPKAPTTLPMEMSSPDEAVNDDMIQIVQSLDSIEEAQPAKEHMVPEESRAYFYSHPVSEEIIKETFKDNEEQRPRKRENDDLGLPDLDVLDLTQIGESIGDELGIFGDKKRTIRNNEDSKLKGGDDDYSEYDDVIDTMGDALLLARKSNPKNKNKKKRGRQNKMMRGDWALV